MTILFLVLFGSGFGCAVLVLVYAVTNHLVLRHIRANHPVLWKTLGTPDLATAQGSRPDRLGDWIAKGKYRKMHDPYLHRWCPVLQKLRPFAAGWIFFVVLSGFATAIVVEFFWK